MNTEDVTNARSFVRRFSLAAYFGDAPAFGRSLYQIDSDPREAGGLSFDAFGD
jgi:hypothetical protein